MKIYPGCHDIRQVGCFLTRFSTKTAYCNGEVGGQADRQASTFRFRSITSVCFGLLTPNLVYG